MLPVTIHSTQHSISQTNISPNISPNAIKVLYGLKDAGFDAYLVGGSVRDLLLNLHPKDFDVVTDATPEQVRKLFKNSILIGRRFRLAHVRFGREIIEVTTFRTSVDNESDTYQRSEHGMLMRDNVYGTIEEDVWRRDFTVNALYYRIKDFSVVDYVGGLDDLKAKKIRMIGRDPSLRYREDPVRMLRAIRLAAKLGFTIEKKTAVPIEKLAPLLVNVSAARLFEEVVKWFRSGKSLEVFNLLQKYKLFDFLFAQSAASLQGKENKFATTLLHCGFLNTDKRIQEGKTVIPAFLYAVILWHPLQEQIKVLCKDGKSEEATILHRAMQNVLHKQKNQTVIPQKVLFAIKDIWQMQHQLLERKKRKIHYLLSHPKFRAAYDFLLLRVQAGEDLKSTADWWTQIQELGEVKRYKLIEKCVNK